MNRSGGTIEMTQKGKKLQSHLCLLAVGVVVLAIKETFLRQHNASVRRRLRYAMALRLRLGVVMLFFQHVRHGLTPKAGAANDAEPRTQDSRPDLRNKTALATLQTLPEKHSRGLAKDVESLPLGSTLLGAL